METNVENPGLICSPVSGKGIRGLLGARSNVEVTLAGEGEGESEGSGNNPGKRSAMMDDKHATMKDTTAA